MMPYGDTVGLQYSIWRSVRMQKNLEKTYDIGIVVQLI